MASFQAKTSRQRPKKKEKIKIIVPNNSYSTWNSEFQKNSRKIKKIKKTPLLPLFRPKQVGKGREKEKIKIIVPIRS